MSPRIAARFSLTAAVLFFAQALRASPEPPAAAQATPSPAPIGADVRHLLPQWAPFVRVETLIASGQPTYHQATGKIAYDDDHTQRIFSPLPGRVLKVHARLGDRVRPHDPLITLASAEATQLWGEAQRAKLAYLAAKKAIDRVHALKRDGAIAERDVILAESELTLAQSTAKSSQAQIDALGITLDGGGHQATLRAHLGGKITARQVAPGQDVRADAQEPLMVLSDLDTVWVLADIFEQDLALVSQGGLLQLRVSAYPKAVFSGTIDHISDTVDAASRTIKVRGVVHNDGHRLKPDMFVAVSLAQSDTHTISVPSRALVTDEQGPLVIVVGERDALSVRRVEVGPLSGGRYKVISGVQEHERVITQGAPFVLQNLRD